MIQDIAPHRFDNAFRSTEPQQDDRMMVFAGRTMLVHLLDEAGTFEFPTYGHTEPVLPHPAVCVYAFSIDDEKYFVSLGEGGDAPAGLAYVPLETFRMAARKHMGHAAQTGWHLHRWYTRSKHCGACGSEMRHTVEERAMECPVCGNRYYPPISPAVIVAVTDGDKLLMTRYSRGAYRLRALVAGFCEIGETAEQTVAREVLEETGLRVKNIRYYKSQPWGYAGDLLLGYVCDLDGSPEVSLDDAELASAEWVPRDEIVEEDDGASLTREMIARFKNGLL
ncbi:NAD(+) diphosphatase [Slackia heliotrinireducens]|uniref:NAD(+) diphosphatase n=1 Tax=Slackia heliotrinireducens TaxID=84110 RepID=UPI003315365D